MAQPTDLPTWDTSLTNIVDPGASQKASGFTVSQAPPSSYHNWLFNRIGQWLNYLKNLASEALTWTVTQTFTPSAGNTTAIVATGTGTGYAVDAKTKIYTHTGFNVSGVLLEANDSWNASGIAAAVSASGLLISGAEDSVASMLYTQASGRQTLVLKGLGDDISGMTATDHVGAVQVLNPIYLGPGLVSRAFEVVQYNGTNYGTIASIDSNGNFSCGTTSVSGVMTAGGVNSIGLVTAGTGITSTTGNITATAGHVMATAGNVIATAGEFVGKNAAKAYGVLVWASGSGWTPIVSPSFHIGTPTQSGGEITVPFSGAGLSNTPVVALTGIDAKFYYISGISNTQFKFKARDFATMNTDIGTLGVSTPASVSFVVFGT